MFAKPHAALEPLFVATVVFVVILGTSLHVADASRSVPPLAVALGGASSSQTIPRAKMTSVGERPDPDTRALGLHLPQGSEPVPLSDRHIPWNSNPVLQQLGKIRATLTRSKYTHGFRVDEARGIYYFDCSGMAEWVLQQVAPVAAASARRGLEHRPVARNFYQRIAAVEPGDTELGWTRVERVSEMRPGDVVAWLKPNEIRSSNTGHIAFVLTVPEPVPDLPGAYLVRIADSTSLPHEDDQRFSSKGGFGMGTILLQTNADGMPVGYGWAARRFRVFKTAIAMGRPVG